MPITNWAGNVTFGAARVHRPATLGDLRHLVATSRRVRALGSGHSFSLVADTVHDLVRLDALPGSVEIDTATSTAAVSAGLRYADVAEHLHHAGYALATLASLPHISVAGSCATATHGSGDGSRCLAAAVVAVEMVGPEGDLVTLSRDHDPGVFPGAVVALGALGIVTRLTLEIEPAYEVAQRVRLDVPLTEVADCFDEVFGAAYSVSTFTDWRSGRAAVWLKHRLDAPGPRPESGWAGGRAAERPMHPVPGMPARACTKQQGVPGPWHERLPHFRPAHAPSAGQELQSEYYLPRQAAGKAFAAIAEIGPLVAPVLHISEVRTVRGDDLWLSPAYDRDSLTIHFTWIRDTAAVMPALRAVEERLLPLGARPHWGKLTTARPRQIGALYERAADFARLRRRLDPPGKFRNAYVDALFPA
ncbi:D-arabinono-1,4-lactone oxidase [Nonomuraea typhae]|uniref:D-arabinono-1,4-lactone oxidase n=1 Tax=Nonomuraea typhae TaxID=2603600 RepID=UPI0015E20453|nr:D-arabinono-1,4-lactone oxidase [Nonomuraea typhae]